MNIHTWWYLSRASGMVAWIVTGAACLWGILLITRMLKPADRPAWLLDLHRWLGILSIITVVVHMLTLIPDSWTTIGAKQLLVPGACTYDVCGIQSGAATWGVIAFYILVVVQITSYFMKHMPRRLWHGIHLLSYVMFVMATVHGVQAGTTDRGNIVFILVAAGGSAIVIFAFTARVLQARHKKITNAQKAAFAESNS
jgi:predicted ferric reductase